ncbi:MAG TPA: hypothetical protein VF669_08300 [Tepidisphaeraceae bacterium]|jgi:hypothetical protein
MKAALLLMFLATSCTPSTTSAPAPSATPREPGLAGRTLADFPLRTGITRSEFEAVAGPSTRTTGFGDVRYVYPLGGGDELWINYCRESDDAPPVLYTAERVRNATTVDVVFVYGDEYRTPAQRQEIRGSE